MGHEKELINLIDEPNVTSWDFFESSSHDHVTGYLTQYKERITIIYECDSAYTAFVLALVVYNKVSVLSNIISFYLSRDSREWVIRTSFEDCIIISYIGEHLKTHYPSSTRIDSLRVLTYLFRQVRKLNIPEITIQEDIYKSTFYLVINGEPCFESKYQPVSNGFANVALLRIEVNSILSNSIPTSVNESEVYLLGEKLISIKDSLSLPEELAFLDDIDTSHLNHLERILVSPLAEKPSKPLAQPKPKSVSPVLPKKKNKITKAEKKVIKARHSLPSIWARIELRDDHDD